MAMREKLIELFRAIAHENCFGSIENIADYLIANGVTLQSRDCYWATEQAYKNGYEKGLLDGKGCCADCKSCWKTKLVNAPYRWIPVAERLPEAGMEVLAMLQVNKFDGHDAHNVTTAVILPSGSWLVADYQEGIEAETSGTDCEDCSYWITHWRKLPAPPEENKEGAAYGESD